MAVRPYAGVEVYTGHVVPFTSVRWRLIVACGGDEYDSDAWAWEHDAAASAVLRYLSRHASRVSVGLEDGGRLTVRFELEGDAARAFEAAARLKWHEPEALVKLMDMEPREVLAELLPEEV